MSQFYVYENKNKMTAAQYPYLLDVQSNLLSELRTTVVIPLTSSHLNKALMIKRLMPEFNIQGESFIMLTPQMAGVDRKFLGKQYDDLKHERTVILAAIDFLMTGI